MLALLGLAIVWTFMSCFQTKSVVKSQYLWSAITEICICICWFLSMEVIVVNKFSAKTFVVYVAGCLIGLILGIWTHGKLGKKKVEQVKPFWWMLPKGGKK